MIQRKSSKLCKQAERDWKRELFVWLYEIWALLKDITKMSQRGVLGPKEVPMLGGVPKR